MDLKLFFEMPTVVAHKQYEALRMYYIDEAPAHQVAQRYGYTYRAFTSLVTTFRRKIIMNPRDSIFFIENSPGRKVSAETNDAKSVIISMRKKYYSVPEIKVALDGLGHNLSEKNIYNILSSEGFSRLPRRSKLAKQQLDKVQVEAEESIRLSYVSETFKSSNAGILMFLALKLANRRRYSSDDTWCMDRGMGLFAGLNVLPKTAWYTSYSDRVTPEMNRSFLKKLHQLWLRHGLLEDTANLDFTTIPYWGDDSHLENNWSGKRGKALASMLAVLAHDPDSGLIDYGSADVMQNDESAVVLEFLDFYREGDKNKENKLRYIVFDSKFTNYENLRNLDDGQVKFITIRRRGKLLPERIDNLPATGWKTVRVECAGNKQRMLKVFDEMVFIKGYDKEIRQITITGNGKIKPAIIITNDTDLHVEQIIRKYTRRRMVEKTISEQIDFFHLNLVSSSMVIKVDFDLTMSILAHNLYRVFANELGRYSNNTAQTMYDKFVLNGADIEIGEKAIKVLLKKKRQLPLILETMQRFNKQKYPVLSNKNLIFEGATYS